MIRVGGCERAICFSPPESHLGQLEFFAEFQASDTLEIDLEVGEGGIFVGTCPAVRREVHAVLAGEAQLETPRFLAELGIDRRAHRY